MAYLQVAKWVIWPFLVLKKIDEFSVKSLLSLKIKANDGNGGTAIAYSNYTSKVEQLVSVDEKIIPKKYSLSQNYPNPFNPSTNFKYGLKESSNIVLEIYNVQGRRVKILVNERQSAGYHTLRVDMSDLSSGVYLYRLRAGNFVKSRKMILLK